MRGWSALILMLWILCFVLFILGCENGGDDDDQQSNGCNWNISVLDSSGKVDGIPSLFVDSRGNLHVSYYYCKEREYGYCKVGQLRYMTNISGEWQKFVVDSKGDPGWGSSIFVEEDGTVHIAYNNDDWNSLMHATNASGEWQTAMVDASWSCGWRNGIGVDADGNVHILYNGNYDYYTDEALKYATNASGEWKVYVVEMSTLGYRPSMTMDLDGTAHIASGHYLRELVYITGLPGSWQSFTIDSRTPGHTDIVVDSKGKVHISYDHHYELVSSLRYATNSSGEWRTEIVCECKAEGTSIAMDEGKKVHIVFVTFDNSWGLKYATNASGSWRFCAIEPDIGSPQPSLALDQKENLHLIYVDRAAHNLKYATTANE